MVLYVKESAADEWRERTTMAPVTQHPCANNAALHAYVGTDLTSDILDHTHPRPRVEVPDAEAMVEDQYSVHGV